jgi:hypothetical protein
MDPAEYNFSLWQGATWSRQMTLKIDDVASNLAAYSARMKIRSTHGSTVFLSLTDQSGITMADGDPNITVTITDEQTAALDFVFAIYDLEIESPQGVTDRLLYGRITLRKEVTV